jgi:hypothetical protein
MVNESAIRSLGHSPDDVIGTPLLAAVHPTVFIWSQTYWGGGVAMLGFGFSESIASWFSGTPVGDQFAALLGTFSLRPSGYLVLAAQAVLIAAITAWASRRTLFATLDDIE